MKIIVAFLMMAVGLEAQLVKTSTGVELMQIQSPIQYQINVGTRTPFTLGSGEVKAALGIELYVNYTNLFINTALWIPSQPGVHAINGPINGFWSQSSYCDVNRDDSAFEVVEASDATKVLFQMTVTNGVYTFSGILWSTGNIIVHDKNGTRMVDPSDVASRNVVAAITPLFKYPAADNPGVRQ